MAGRGRDRWQAHRTREFGVWERVTSISMFSTTPQDINAPLDMFTVDSALMCQEQYKDGQQDAVELSVAKCSCCCIVWPREGTLVLMVWFVYLSFTVVR